MLCVPPKGDYWIPGNGKQHVASRVSWRLSPCGYSPGSCCPPAQVLTATAGLIEDVYSDDTEPPPNKEKIQSGGALRKGFAANDNV